MAMFRRNREKLAVDAAEIDGVAVPTQANGRGRLTELGIGMGESGTLLREMMTDTAGASFSQPAIAGSSESYAGGDASEQHAYFQKMKQRIHQQLMERLDVQTLRTLPT